MFQKAAQSIESTVNSKAAASYSNPHIVTSCAGLSHDSTCQESDRRRSCRQADLRSKFLGLIGANQSIKPFECVGTFQEASAAVELTLLQYVLSFLCLRQNVVVLPSMAVDFDLCVRLTDGDYSLLLHEIGDYLASFPILLLLCGVVYSNDHSYSNKRSAHEAFIHSSKSNQDIFAIGFDTSVQHAHAYGSAIDSHSFFADIRGDSLIITEHMTWYPAPWMTLEAISFLYCHKNDSKLKRKWIDDFYDDIKEKWQLK
jgi:hypothetical protein